MILPVGRDGDGSALVVFLASIRCSVWGHSDPHAGRIDVHIAPDVGATSFGSPPVANRAHRRSNSRPLRKRSQSRRNYKAGCWQGVFREHVRSLPNISGLTGATAGKGAPSPWSRPDRATSCCSGASAEAVPFPGIAGRFTSLLRFLRRKESNEIGYE